MKTKQNKHMKMQRSYRLSTLVIKLLELERSAGDYSSDAEALESLVLKASISPEAQKIILAEFQHDPRYAAVMRAIKKQTSN